MRVLCSVTGSPSHALEMVPVASALVRAGHDVLVACCELAAPGFADSGLRLRTVLPEQAPFWADMLRGEGLSPGDIVNPSEDQVLKVIAGRPLLGKSFEALRSLAVEYEPDLILRDGLELSACLVAESLGLPHVSVPSGGTSFLDPRKLLAPLNESRADRGLPVQNDPFSVYRYGRIDCVPPEYSLAAYPLPDAVAYQPAATTGRDVSLPAWVTELDPAKPLVYCAIGLALPAVVAEREKGAEITLAADPYAGLRLMVAAVSELDCTAIVATGGLSLGDMPLPGHVRVVDWVPQALLVECVQLFLTHGGQNSVQHAMRSGVPMVVTPLFGDQLHYAERVHQLGLGLRVTSGNVADVAAACWAVLGDQRIAARVRHAKRTLLALPHIDGIVSYLESLGSGRASS